MTKIQVKEKELPINVKKIMVVKNNTIYLYFCAYCATIHSDRILVSDTMFLYLLPQKDSRTLFGTI